MSGQTITRALVILQGATLLHAETLQEIATLGEDGHWRTPGGAVTDSIGVPHEGAKAIVTPSELRRAHKEQDAAWLSDALIQLRGLARRQTHVTVDDCWAQITMPPRNGTQMSALMVAGGREGIIETTDEDRPSTRTINGGRRVRVWRSLIYTPAQPPPGTAGFRPA